MDVGKLEGYPWYNKQNGNVVNNISYLVQQQPPDMKNNVMVNTSGNGGGGGLHVVVAQNDPIPDLILNRLSGA